jgi:uncharacterized metal-binding protein YceD (DUF177 family)
MIRLIPPELPDTIRFDAVPVGGCEINVRADPAACEALAERMNIPAVLECSARFTLRRAGGRAVDAEGWLRAAVVLTCVVTTEPFEQLIDDSFEVRFVPSGTEQAQPDPDSTDEIPYEDGVLALGEAVAEQMALVLPAFPRGPDAPDFIEVADLEEGSEGQPANPFAALAGRRKPV